MRTQSPTLLLAIACAALSGALCSPQSVWALERVPAAHSPPAWKGEASGSTRPGRLDLRICVARSWSLTFGPIVVSIACKHFPVLRQVEEAFPNEVVVLGIHAPKFFNERDDQNIREAIVRHDIRHPVLNDANAGGGPEVSSPSLAVPAYYRSTRLSDRDAQRRDYIRQSSFIPQKGCCHVQARRPDRQHATPI